MVAKRAFSVIALELLAAACSTDIGGNDDLARGDRDARDERSGRGEGIGRVRPAIVGGSASDETQDATVMLFHLDPSGPRRLGICTAALVAPRLVLTARHCVAETDEEVACDSDGTPILGARVIANHEAANLYVFTGKDRPELIGEAPPSLDTTKWKPAGKGLEIIDDRSGTLCNHDLALVLLKEPILNVPLATLRLDSDAVAGEKLLTVGWGVSFSEVEPTKRQQRDGVTVKRVGPSDSIPVLTKSELLFDESICLGDSGGPVFARDTNAIVGVVSRGGNGLDPNKGGPSSTCEGADNVATKLSPFRELVMDAFERAGAEPKLERKPEETCSAGLVGASGPPPAGSFVLGIGVALLTTLRRRRTT
jgi:Trypsin